MKSVPEALAELDLDTPDDVADMLRREGVRGAPRYEDLCPLAVWLGRETGRYVSVDDFDVMTVNDRGGFDPFRLPAAAALFVRRFDDDGYPDLAVGEER